MKPKMIQLTFQFESARLASAVLDFGAFTSTSTTIPNRRQELHQEARPQHPLHRSRVDRS
jgi:hypothetical protein